MRGLRVLLTVLTVNTLRAMPHSLSHIRILVTRPAAQANKLCAKIEAEGGVAIRFPVMEIVASSKEKQAKQTLSELQDDSILIFVSTNAVEYGLAHIDLSATNIKVAAIGPATLRALQAQQVEVQITPQAPFNSEALLSHPDLQKLDNKHVIILRGEGGREELANQLKARNAKVQYAEVYQRRLAATNPAPLINALKRHEIDVITISSNQILLNLLDILGPENQHLIQTVALISWGPRIIKITDTLNFAQPPLIAQQSDDDGVMDTLKNWAAAQQQTKQ